MLKKILSVSLFAIFVLVVSFGIASTKNTAAEPSAINSAYYLNSVFSTTSPPTYLTTSTATTTLIMPAYSGDIAAMNVFITASTTGTKLLYSVQYSDDQNCLNNQYATTTSISTNATTCNWYTEDQSSNSSGVVTEPTAIYHTWTPGNSTSSTTGQYFLINSNLAANFVRIGFQVTGANAGLYVQGSIKSQEPQ